MSGDRITTGMDAVVVRVVADDGTVGIGESGTVGVTFDAQHLAGQLAGVKVLASGARGSRPSQSAVGPSADDRSDDRTSVCEGPARHRRVGSGRPGCWHAAVATVGWRRAGADAAVPTGAGRHARKRPQPARSIRLGQGYRRLQVKVGDDPIVDAQRVLAVRAAVGDDIVIFADANCGFSLSAARRFVRELGPDGAGIFLEQPCATLADCGRLRASWTGPMVMDETIVSLSALLEAHRLGVADGVTVKLTRVGGITPAITIRDVAVELGIGVTVEDASGCDLADTTFAHMNASTPDRLRVHTVDFDSWVTITHVDGPSPRDGSVLRPQAEAPGLGVAAA